MAMASAHETLTSLEQIITHSMISGASRDPRVDSISFQGKPPAVFPEKRYFARADVAIFRDPGLAPKVWRAARDPKPTPQIVAPEQAASFE